MIKKTFNNGKGSSINHNEILYGKDDEEKIVSIQKISDTSVRLYIRKEDEIHHRDERYYPFFFFEDKQNLSGFNFSSNNKKWIIPLSGENYYKYLAIFETRKDYRAAIDHIKKDNEDKIYDKGDAVNHFLHQTGKTLFKGMMFSDLKRMQLDIETYYGKSNDKEKHTGFASQPVIVVALSDSTGWEKVLDMSNKTEKELLTTLVKVIRDRDPDVIEGHNIYSFDLPYLQKRCEINKVDFAIGRDGTSPRSFPSSIRFAERIFDYSCFSIQGRHIIDTLFLVQHFDVTKRSLPSYGLKQVARYFGFASQDRTYIEYKDIADLWDNDRETLLKYALDDVRETAKLSEMLSGSYFYLTQMVPLTFEQVARIGPAAKIESLFVRYYLNKKHSLPKPQVGQQETGGLTRVYLKGVLGPIVYADVESLYPSIMLTYKICPKTDEVGLFLKLLTSLKDMRFMAKDKMNQFKKEGNEEEARRYDAMQNSYKTIINSMYGYLGFRFGLFNDYQEADRVTSTGQKIARQMMQEFEKKGAKVVEMDTDGVYLIPPEYIDTEQKEILFVQEVSDLMPQGIRIGFDGRFKKMISYKKKNYVLLTYNDEMKIKGSSLVSRSGEKFGRSFVREAFKKILNDDVEGIRQLYLNFHEKILSRKMSIDEFSRTETIKKNLDDYFQHLKEKKGKITSYEVAIKYNLSIKKGDRISYYIANNGLAASYLNAKPTSKWNEKLPDQNVEFYLQRLKDFTDKLKDFFQPSDFACLFSNNELFPVNTDEIKIIKRFDVSDEEISKEEQSIPF